MTKETDNHDASVTQASAQTEDASARATDTAAADSTSSSSTASASAAEQASRSRPGAAASGTKHVPPLKRPVRRSFSLAWLLALILVLALLALGYGAWQQSQAFGQAGREVASRLEGMESQLAAAQRDAQQALALARAQDANVRANDAALKEARSQYLALEQAWQRFSNGTDDHFLIDDVARAVEIANQQLRLAGSVNNALVAMETASARLADNDRPRFQALKAAIDTDLDRLRAVPVIDVPAVAARLHRLQAVLAVAPLMVPDAAAPRPAQPNTVSAPVTRANEADALPADASWWTRWQATASDWMAQASDAVTQELRGFVSVQRAGNPDALRLSPEQGAYLRNGVRTRLLTAQLALMLHQPEVWQGELGAVRTIVTDYYDDHTPDAKLALSLLDELQGTAVVQTLPSLQASLQALESLRAASRQAAGAQEE